MTQQTALKTIHSQVEVGMDYYAFFDRVTPNIQRYWQYLGYYISVRSSYSAEQLVRVYMQKIVYLHGVSVSIKSDRGSQFSSSF